MKRYIYDEKCDQCGHTELLFLGHVPGKGDMTRCPSCGWEGIPGRAEAIAKRRWQGGGDHVLSDLLEKGF